METGRIMGVTAITDVFPDGQKVIACAIEYSCAIKNDELELDTFTVEDKLIVPQYLQIASCVNGGFVNSLRTITRIYANTEPDVAKEGRDGKYVVIELSRFDLAAGTVCLTGIEWNSRAHMKPVRLYVSQKREIMGVDGTVCPIPECQVFNNKTVNHVVDDFRQLEYQGLKYNLFVPKDYDPSKKYPLVQFIVDAWGLGHDQTITLAQGIGGVVWARPEEQAKHECFVVAPQFEEVRLCDDDWSVSDEVEKDKKLLDYLLDTWSIDRDRVYTTGQSMGYLSGCELNIRYPDFFAASLMVSGFWNPERMRALKDQTMWFLVSEGDTRAFENTSAAMANIEADGGEVARFHWDARKAKSELNRLVREAAKDPRKLKFTTFVKDSTVAPYMTVCNESSNHRGGWDLVYDLEEVRNWLFTNKRNR